MKALTDIKKESSLYEKLKMEVDLIIFDEGHKEPADDWKNSIRELGKKVILFTATPIRNDSNQFEIDKDYIYNYPHHAAVNEQFIRDVCFNGISILNKNDRLNEFIGKVITASDGYIQKNPDLKIIFQFNNYEDLNNAFEILNNMGRDVIAIHDRYEDNNYQFGIGTANQKVKNVPDVKKVSVNYWLHQNKLIEGIDDSLFQIVAIYDAFSDVRSLVQQIGRIIRKSDPISEEKAFVYFSLDGENQEKLWKEYMLYERKLEEDINLIYFSFEEFLKKH